MPRSLVRCLRFFLVGLVLLAGVVPTTAAQETASDPLAPWPLVSAEQKALLLTLERQLSQLAGMEEVLGKHAESWSEQISALTVADASEALLQQARVDTEKWRLRRKELTYRLDAGKKRIEALTRTVEDLKARLQLLGNPARQKSGREWYTQQLELDRQALAQRSFNLALEQKRRDIFTLRLQGVTQMLAKAELWERHVRKLHELRLDQVSDTVRGHVDSRMDLQNLDFFEQFLALTRQLQQEAQNLADPQRRLLETKRDVTLDWSYATAQKAILNNFAGILTNAENLTAGSDETSKVLGKSYREILQLKNELKTLAEDVARRVRVYEQQSRLIQERLHTAGDDRDVVAAEATLVNDLLAVLRQILASVKQKRSRVADIAPRLRAHYHQVRDKELFERRTLPLGSEQRATVAGVLAETPALLFYQLHLSVTSLLNALGRFAPEDWMIVSAWAVGLFLALAALRYGLRRLDGNLRQGTATPVIARFVALLLELLRMNRLGIGLVLVLTALNRVLTVAPPSEEIVVILLSCAVGAKLAVDLTWLLLARPDLPAAQRYLRLYRLLAIALWSGGLLTALTMMGHFSLLSDIVLDVLDRMFMLYLLLTAIPMLWLHWVLMQGLLSYYGSPYWVRLLRWTSLIIPVALLGIGLAGSLGYLNLAWFCVRYLLIFSAVLVGWALSQQLLGDAAAWLKHRALERSRRQWSIIRRVVDAVHRVLGLWLFLAAIFLLIEFYSLEGIIADAWKVLMTAIVIVTALYETFFLVADLAAEKNEGALIGKLIDQARKPLGVILPIAAAQITLPRLALPEHLIALVGHGLVLVQITAILWLFLRLISLLEQVAEYRYRRTDVKEDLVVRRARTQLRVLRQSLHITIIFIGIGGMLMTFPGIRQLGAGLLASAGAAGLVIGIAARPLFENLIAGIQIGLTQPIRLDDVVIVEGEWGTIEEINATYVVVQIWDDRRLVVPLKYFNEHPFQHWSRKGTELLGSVFLNVDYSFPLEEGRKALKGILDATDMWDGRAWGLQVTDSKEDCMELRALATARDAGTAWDLRCYVREKLITFIQQHYPASLPQRRNRFLVPEEQKEEKRAVPSFSVADQSSMKP